MIHPANISLVKHEEVGIEIDSRYVGIYQEVFQKE
jgi:hypothetical protein